jgi:hypothetical protein
MSRTWQPGGRFRIEMLSGGPVRQSCLVVAQMLIVLGKKYKCGGHVSSPEPAAKPAAQDIRTAPTKDTQQVTRGTSDLQQNLSTHDFYKAQGSDSWTVAHAVEIDPAYYIPSPILWEQIYLYENPFEEGYAAMAGQCCNMTQEK